ncbi:FAD-dependent oxidoreductase [Streptomyces dioscori]|uniref:FAD-dependent oxidoreductase n=1 Tax=Streptomyces dioscori TaxID=2109333 RepID=A0A2P8QGI9_9ACTN|nr:FAD-dependent oxidoreductase [Streptomyces dioscori]PSM45366.1 FAD-dependent oxidoreductase [Streptomyces dioscori]
MYESAARVFARLSTDEPLRRTRTLMDRAVVLGGSLAGLLAARVLSDHAESVVVVERDSLPPAAAARPGTPHDGQLHTLMHGGRMQLQRLFPGFEDEARAGGAIVSSPYTIRAYADGVPKVSDGSMGLISSSRPFLEALVRRRTLALPNVKVLTCRAIGLEFRGEAVSGVRCGPVTRPGTAAAGGSGSGEWVEDADFVVDAMGRASKLGDWLEKAGWERPAMRRMAIDIDYATGYFRRTTSDPELAAAIAYRTPTPTPPRVASGAITAIEGDRWLITLANYGKQPPIRDVDEFRKLCGELPPVYREAVEGEQLGDILTYHQADSRRRDYHLLKRFPARLISVGDAVASFNPIYGQGMSSAALHASALSHHLRSAPDLRGPAHAFFADQRVVVDAAWQISSSADLARHDVQGPYPRGYRLTKWFAEQIAEASITDREVAVRFNSVTYMRSHPSSLAAPATLLRALRVNRSSRKPQRERG